MTHDRTAPGAAEAADTDARRPPGGCRWCGLLPRGHFQRHAEPVGWHGWTQPTAAQTKARMLARRRARELGQG